MTTVIRINLLYSQTPLIIAGSDVTLYRMLVSNTFTVNVIFLNQILGDLLSNLAIEMSQNNTLTHGKL